MQQPIGLMCHTLDHYATTFTKTEGEQIATDTLLQENVRCNVQQPSSELVTEYAQRGLALSQVAYLVDQSAYDLITVEDRIVFDGVAYEVKGKRNLCNLGWVYQVDLVEVK